MIINKKTYETLSQSIINHFNYVLIRFHITDNKMSSELILLQNIYSHLHHLKRHLYLPIYDANIYHRKSEKYIEHLQSIQNDKLFYINKVEFTQIMEMLKEKYPTFMEFLTNPQHIENEIALIKQTIDVIDKKLNTIQKKLNKLIDYSFTKNDIKELENYKAEKFQKYFNNYLNPIENETDIDVQLLDIKEEIAELTDKLKRLIDVRDIVPVDLEIGTLKKEIASLKHKEKLYEPITTQPKRQPKIITLEERENLQIDFFNSEDFKAHLEFEEQRLRRKNIEMYLLKEQLKDLLPFFTNKKEKDKEENIYIINSNEDFEEQREILKREAYKKIYEINYKLFLESGKLPPKLNTYSQNLYARFQREIITINLYSLEHPYSMENEVKEALSKIYEKADRQFNYLLANEDICMSSINLEEIEEEIKYNYSQNREFFNNLQSLGIDGSDWQEKAIKMDIEIPYEMVFGEEVEYLENIADKIEIFQDDITIKEFNNFLQDNSLNKFNTNSDTHTMSI